MDLDHRKPVALLAYLAVTRQIHTRDALAALFWPEYGEARTYLRNNLWIIRKALGAWAEHWLEIEADMVGFKEGAPVWLDVAEVQRLLAACRTHGHPEQEVCARCLAYLAEAAALYQDDFLAGFTLRDSPAFDQWQFFQGERLRQQLAGTLEKLVYYHHTAQGQFDQAIAYAQRWLALDPLQEAAQRQLMQLYTWAGQPAAALRQYQACVRTLRQELHAQPAPETEALYQAIKSRQPLPHFALVQPKDMSFPAPNYLASTVLRPASLPTLPAVDGQERSPNNLLAQLTPLVGREKERTLLQRFLRRQDVRLVTLTGPGGVGKTRLALQLAADVLDDFTDGAFFVPLAPVHDTGLIPSALAQTLGIHEIPGQPLLETLKSELHDRQMLLILDNYEHLVTAAPLVAELLSACSQLKLLV
ncbi:MAG TPA: BTAD domain-containing putative transcriptional regulator, partial [Caldilineaceae bacterium]|nr:BTAD domain-containing putative transcriptional regulator [Caldilineaceae bacterium]